MKNLVKPYKDHEKPYKTLKLIKQKKQHSGTLSNFQKT